MDSVAFDRASEIYDATRALPPDTRDEVLSLLVTELSGRGACLEIGTGTGRFSYPLHERGVQMVGCDLSRRMLAKLVEKGGGSPPFPIFVADATNLPCPASAFGAVLACHVLHLIPSWRQAVDEALRVLRPGGTFLVDLGGPVPAPWGPEAMRLLALHGVLPIRPGVTDADELTASIGGRARLRPLRPVPFSERRSLEDDISSWERQENAWTWAYTADQMATASAEVRAWAEAGGWPIHAAHTLTGSIQWWAFDVP